MKYVKIKISLRIVHDVFRETSKRYFLMKLDNLCNLIFKVTRITTKLFNIEVIFD